MKKALILHGWYEKPDTQWYPWLKNEFEKKGYEVFVPELPTMQTNLPSLIRPLRLIDKSKYVDRDTIVVGHSLGAVLGIRLAEKRAFKKLFLVAGWDYDDLYPQHRLFWKTRINHKKIRRNVKEIYCFTSENDPYITFFQVEEMNKRLGGKVILVKNAGHFTEKYGVKEIPILLQYI